MKEIHYASFFKRVQAFSIDTSILMIFLLLDTFIVASKTSQDTSRIVFAAFYVLFIIIPQVFWRGQTVGKHMIKIKVINDNEQDTGVIKLLFRLFLRDIVGIFTFGLTLIISAIILDERPDKKSLHDLVSKTIVIDLDFQKYKINTKDDKGFHILNEDKFRSGMD